MHTLKNIFDSINRSTNLTVTKDINILFVDVTSILIERFSDDFNIGISNKVGLIDSIVSFLTKNIIEMTNPRDVVYYIFDGTPHTYRSYKYRHMIHKNPYLINLINDSSFLHKLYIGLESDRIVASIGVRTIIISRSSHPRETADKINLYLESMGGGEYFTKNIGVISRDTDVLSVCLINNLFNITVYDPIDNSVYDVDRMRLAIARDLIYYRSLGTGGYPKLSDEYLESLSETDITDMMLDFVVIVSTLYDSRSNPQIENLEIRPDSSWNHRVISDGGFKDEKHEDFNMRALFSIITYIPPLHSGKSMNMAIFYKDIYRISIMIGSVDKNKNETKYTGISKHKSIVDKYIQDYLIPGIEDVLGTGKIYDIPISKQTISRLKISHFDKMFLDIVVCIYLNSRFLTKSLSESPDFIYNCMSTKRDGQYAVMYLSSDSNIQSLIESRFADLRYSNYLLNVQYVTLVSSRESTDIGGHLDIKKIISDNVVHPIEHYYPKQFVYIPVPPISDVRMAVKSNIQITNDFLSRYKNSSPMKITVPLRQYIENVKSKQRYVKTDRRYYGGDKDTFNRQTVHTVGQTNIKQDEQKMNKIETTRPKSLSKGVNIPKYRR